MNGSSKPQFANTGFQSSFRSLWLETIFTQRGYKSRPSSQANSQKPLQRNGFFTPSSLTILMNLKFLTVKIGDVPMDVAELNEEGCEII